MRKPIHFFLGANSGGGFCSLYDQLLGGSLNDLLILKGGPGCGKSSFMRRVAQRLTDAGMTADLIHCSGDPASLDGAIVPALRAGMVDGTAPHAVEPNYAAAVERYVDLMRFYDVEAVRREAPRIAALTDAYRAAYADAYRALRSVCAVEDERRASLRAAFDGEKLARRAAGIAARELKGGGKSPGRVARVFLGGMTHEGFLCRYDSADALCGRVYELTDSGGLGAPLLRTLCEAAVKAGEDVLACPDPLRPEELRHLLVPERGVAFVTSDDRTRYPHKPYRRIRLDAMAEKNADGAARAKRRFLRRIARTLSDEAEAALRRAKAAHDELEGVCNPFVDFDGVYALAEREAERLLSRVTRET